MNLRSLKLPILAAATLVAAGIGLAAALQGGGPGDATANHPDDRVDETAAHTYPSHIQSIFDRAPAGQQALLRDGVTIADFNAAAENYLACIEAKGGEVTRFPGEGLRQLYWTYTIPASSADGAQSVHAGCYAENLDAVQAAWVDAREEVPPGADVPATMASLEQCVANGGDAAFDALIAVRAPKLVSYPGGASLAAEAYTTTAFARCAYALETAQGFLAPAKTTVPAACAALDPNSVDYRVCLVKER